MQSEKFAIRFGLGGIKAVGFGVMELAVKERELNGKFTDIYNFSERLNPRSINKKSIEALAKSGAFDVLQTNRRQVAESFDILAAYSAEKSEAINSNQMSLFGALADTNAKPELKKTSSWTKAERLQKEFEAFGFFLNEHPLDDIISDLKKRGVVFSKKLEGDELEDNSLLKMAGVIAGSKHRSGPRGRFAYITISDPYGIFEAMIFDESIITSARDILVDGSSVFLECLIKKDDGGTRILVREVKKLEDFIQNTQAQAADFEDIKKQPARNYSRNNNLNSSYTNPEKKSFTQEKTQKFDSEKSAALTKKALSKVNIIIKSRDPIFSLKAQLSQHLAPNSLTKTTAVFISVIGNKNITKIELAPKYLLDELDASRLSKIEKVIDVETTI
jgi:DNA polymerase III alpha subunit